METLIKLIPLVVSLSNHERTAADTKQNQRQCWIAMISWLIVFHVLLAYGLPDSLFWSLAVIAGALIWRIGANESLLLAATLVMVTLIYSFALNITGMDNAIYYRPDERLSLFSNQHNHRIYQPNSNVTMQMPHGDLQSMTQENIAIPRQVVFQVDTYGFRNNADYHGEKYLLVGDSFVAGSGLSQTDMLSSQLNRDYHIAAYNLAHPGDVTDYAAYITQFKRTHDGNAQVLLFIFEGNDFVESQTKQHSAAAIFVRQYKNMFSNSNVFRVTKSLYKRVFKTKDGEITNEVLLMNIQNKQAAFYKPYIEVSRKPIQPPIASFTAAIENISPYLEHIFFIPTNYRVYQPYINPNEVLPNAAWDYLNSICAAKKLKCTNLTEALRNTSATLLKKGELTWWTDDTHWNSHGVAVAARVVAETLNAQ